MIELKFLVLIRDILLCLIKKVLKISSPNPMNPNDTKKDLNPEIKKELEKSKLEVLTNENDFLVKNLKKAG